MTQQEIQLSKLNLIPQYKILKIASLRYEFPLEFQSFDHWNDTFETIIECEEQIKNYGKSNCRYVILPTYIL
jgi:hypothetical protein